MKNVEVTSMGLKLVIPAPDSADEFDKLAGKNGACLEEGIANVIARSTLAEFRDTLLHGREADKDKGIEEIIGLDKQSGVDRKSKVVGKTKGGKDILEWESELDYFKRILATKDWVVEKIQPFADTVIAACPFDPKASESSAKPRKLPAKDRELATTIIDALITKGATTSDNLSSKLQVVGKSFTLTTKPDGDDAAVTAWKEGQIVDLGWKLNAYFLFKAREAEKAAASEINVD